MLPKFLIAASTLKLALAMAPAVAQDIPAPPEAGLSLGRTLEAAAKSARREECSSDSVRGCTFSGLVLDSTSAGFCTDPVMPGERYQIGSETKYGVVLRARIRAAGSATKQIERPVLFLVGNDKIQKICVPETTSVGGTNLEIRFVPWEHMPSAELVRLPDAQWHHPEVISFGLVGGLLATSPGRNASVEAPGIIDWIFNSGRRDPVKLHISSDPAGGVVFVGNRLIGRTDQEFGIAPANVRNIVVVLNGKRIPISECKQLASQTWVRVSCDVGSPRP